MSTASSRAEEKGQRSRCGIPERRRKTKLRKKKSQERSNLDSLSKATREEKREGTSQLLALLLLSIEKRSLVDGERNKRDDSTPVAFFETKTREKISTVIITALNTTKQRRDRSHWNQSTLRSAVFCFYMLAEKSKQTARHATQSTNKWSV